MMRFDMASPDRKPSQSLKIKKRRAVPVDIDFDQNEQGRPCIIKLRVRAETGVLSNASDLEQRRSATKVKDVMHKGVDWVSPDTSVIEFAKLMRDHDVGAIPIGESDRLVGRVTDRIVCKGLAQENFDARVATARDVMTAEIYCCREDDDLAKAVRHMEELKVRRLPVINKQKDDRHSQSRRCRPFVAGRSAVGIHQECFGPSLRAAWFHRESMLRTAWPQASK